MTLSKNRIKYIHSLELKKNRDAEGIFLAEGPKLVGELLDSFPCTFLAATPAWRSRNPQALAEEIVEVTEEELARASLLKTPQQVLALFRKKNETTGKDEIIRSLCLALDGVQDPGNLGTIIRLADWFAIDRVICSKDCVDMYNPKTVQSTMGSLFRVEVFYCDLEDFFKRLPSGLDVYGSLVEEGDSVYGQRLSDNAVLVIGSESHGISERVRKYINRSLNIPCFKHGNRPESLNAAMACAVLLSEFRRNG